MNQLKLFDKDDQSMNENKNFHDFLAKKNFY